MMMMMMIMIDGCFPTAWDRQPAFSLNPLTPMALSKLLKMIGRSAYILACSTAIAPDSNINQTAGSGGHLCMWENRCMHSASVLCRPAETRQRRGEIGSIWKSILMGHRWPNGHQRIIAVYPWEYWNKVLVTRWPSWFQPAQIREETLESGNLFTVFSDGWILPSYLENMLCMLNIYHSLPLTSDPVGLGDTYQRHTCSKILKNRARRGSRPDPKIILHHITSMVETEQYKKVFL